MRTTETLTNEKLQDIYTNAKFRNDVAFAHGFCDAGGKLLGRKTSSYPVAYIVTEEQIAEANTERIRAKESRRSNIGNKLVFVGMGMTYEPRYEDDVCNHRIRTRFMAPSGVCYFIEFGTGRGDNMRVEDAVNLTREGELKGTPDWNKQSEYYIYFGQQGTGSSLKYTLTNVLNFVNRHFNCYFTEIEIDNYDLTTDEFICTSPIGRQIQPQAKRTAELKEAA